MQTGIYESLITQSLQTRLQKLNAATYYIDSSHTLPPQEAGRVLGRHLAKAIEQALGIIADKGGDHVVTRQLEVANSILQFLHKQIQEYQFEDDLVASGGHILRAVINKLTSHHPDLTQHLAEIIPTTGITQSELFTGGKGLSLEQEIKKEIQSADRIDLLVSFIMWGAIRLLLPYLEKFTQRGGQLRVLTTTYMGTTEYKAVDALRELSNTRIKISYNGTRERMHAKAYLFYRNTGFHTGYIGSSNLSAAAITSGLEWNLKVTTAELPHIISKFSKTFESYWESPDFDGYTHHQQQKLQNVLQASRPGSVIPGTAVFFDLQPYHYQQEILDKLAAERTLHNSWRNLVVAATGTGKTMVAAFDFKQYQQQNPSATLLYVAHTIEILQQALHIFRHVLKNQNIGQIMGGGYQPATRNIVFATVQTLNNLPLANTFAPEYYNYIILDEVHHAAASTYQKLINFFKPQILLGLTATPERGDGKSILPDFNNRLAAEIRLPDALNQKLLCPFQYFGLTDSVDYSKLKWANGKYVQEELDNVLTGNKARVLQILHNLNKYLANATAVKAVAFCASINHAAYMASQFSASGLKAMALTSHIQAQRQQILQDFASGNINYLFVVDILNEGVDIPEIDTVLFLRPTESLTIFLQQLGRGLRLHPGKTAVTVLDFVGHANASFSYEARFRSLVGKTNTNMEDVIRHDFPVLPLGCSIVLEEKAREFILANIKAASVKGLTTLQNMYNSFSHQSTLPLTLQNFLHHYQLPLEKLYKYTTFTNLSLSGHHRAQPPAGLAQFTTLLTKNLVNVQSHTYFNFLLNLCRANFQLHLLPNHPANALMAVMLYADAYTAGGANDTLPQAIAQLASSQQLVTELHEYLKYKKARLNITGFYAPQLPPSFPLEVYGRYTRRQILAAIQLSTYHKISSNREGVAENKAINTEALFVTLNKNENEYSPSTMYNDYAISDYLFHTQSQNATSPKSQKGQSYIHQQKLGKTILLFVREANDTEYSTTQSYVFLGPITYKSHTGSKPMNITWQLTYKLPAFLWQQSAKLMAG